MPEREPESRPSPVTGQQPREIDWEKIGEEASQEPNPRGEPTGSGSDAISGITAGSGTSAADTGLIGRDPMTSGLGGTGRTTQPGSGPGTLDDPARWRDSGDEDEDQDEHDDPPRR